MERFLKVRNIIKSLENSTSIKIRWGKLKSEVCGRNSPYITHQSINLTERIMETVKKTNLLISNNKFGIIVRSAKEYDHHKDDHNEEYEGRYVHTIKYYANDIRNILASVHFPFPPFVKDDCELLAITYVDLFNGYDKDGFPQFIDKKTYVSIKISDGKTWENKAEVILNEPWKEL